MIGTQRVFLEGVLFTGGNYETIDEFVGNTEVTKESGPFKVHTKRGIERAHIGDVIVKLKEGDFTIINNPTFAR